MKRAALRIADEKPDFKSRSALAISPGCWRMRNGHTARVDSLLQLPYEKGGKIHHFPCWKGICVECNAPNTWNFNGCYAAVGKHPFDITAPA